MLNLSQKSVLIYDFGLGTEVAVRLAKDFGKVYYFVPWEDAFPKSDKALIGEGLDGVQRVLNFWDYVDKVDLICFFDTYCADMVEYLRKKNYKVWGAGKSEILENNRGKTKQILETLNLPVQEYEIIKGVEELIDYLKENQNKWVKINTFRGDIETFFHKDYDSTQAQFLGEILLDAGAKAKTLEFVVEEDLEGVEPGYDGWVIDGNYPLIAMYGYELKGTGYIGRVVLDKKLPEPLSKINQSLIPVFKKLGGRTFFSTEVIVTKEKKSYLIDPCIRMPLPVPTAIHTEIWKNFSDIIWQGAQGKVIIPRPKALYGAGVVVESSWAEKHWTEIRFPPENRQWIKFRRVAKIDGNYYALPGFTFICSVIGLGNTIDKAIDEVKRHLEGLEIREMSYSLSGLEKIKNEIIPKGRKYGIFF